MFEPITLVIVGSLLAFLPVLGAIRPLRDVDPFYV